MACEARATSWDKGGFRTATNLHNRLNCAVTLVQARNWLPRAVCSIMPRSLSFAEHTDNIVTASTAWFALR
jgi:hypothetical protein